MRSLLTALIILFFSSSAFSQTEIVLPYDTAYAVVDVGNVLDTMGNIYACSSVYNPLLATRADGGDGFVGTLITKLDDSNNNVWQRLYDKTDMAEYDLFQQGNQIFLRGNRLMLPYSATDIIKCRAGVADLTHRNGMLAINTGNGDTLSDAVFDDDQDCGSMLFSGCVAVDSQRFGYFYQFDDSSQTPFFDIWNSGNGAHSAGANTGFGKGANKFFTFQPSLKRWLAIDSQWLYMTDSAGIIVGKYILPRATNNSFLVPQQITANANYCIVSYAEVSFINSETINHMVVYNFDGTVISASTPSILPIDMAITTGDDIWTVTNSSDFPDTTKPSIVIQQLDVYQNSIRYHSIKRPYTLAKSVVVSSNYIVIGGATETNINGPVRSYLYRQLISDIPLSMQLPSTCPDIAIFPNPVSNTLSIYSNNTQLTTSAPVTISNALGQQLGTFTWSQQRLTVDMTPYATGMYFVCIGARGRNNCIQKIVKQ